MPLLGPAEERPDNDPKPVVLFPNNGGGFGWGITTSGVGENGGLPEGYDRTVNMRCIGGRILSPSYAHVVKQALVGKKPPVEMKEWVAGASDSTPILIILHDTGVKIFKNGSLTAETDATTAEYGGAAFYDDGSASFLVVGTTTGSKFLQKRVIAGTWTEGTNAGQYVTEAAGSFYANPTTYQVYKWAAGADPTSASPGSTIRVGTIDAAINSLAAIDAKFIAGKEDGIWVYDEAATRTMNIYRVPKHPDNFRVMRPDGQGGLYTVEDTGDIVHLERFGSIVVANVIRNKSPWRDTPHGPIVDILAHGDKIIGLMDGGYKTSQNIGLVVAVTQDDGATYTVYDSEATDQRLDTVVSLSSLDTSANGDWILIGADVPFFLLDLTMGTANTNAGARLFIKRVSNISGGGVTVSAAVSFSFHDGTQTTPATTGTPLGQSGRLAFDAENQTIATWSTVAVTLNGDSQSRTKYWVQVLLD